MPRQKFKCAGCKRLVAWSFGADDDMPNHCDRCWGRIRKKFEKMIALTKDV